MEAEKKSHQKSDTKVSIERQNNKVVKTDQMSLESSIAGDLLPSSPPGVTHNDCELLREVPYSAGLKHYMAAVQKWVRKIPMQNGGWDTDCLAVCSSADMEHFELMENSS